MSDIVNFIGTDYSNFPVGTVGTALNNYNNGIIYESLTNTESTLSGDTYWISPGAKSTFLQGVRRTREYMEIVKDNIAQALFIVSKIESWQQIHAEYLTAVKNVADNYRCYSRYAKIARTSTGKEKEEANKNANYYYGIYWSNAEIVESKTTELQNLDKEIQNSIAVLQSSMPVLG